LEVVVKLPRRDFLHLAGATAVASAVPRVASALDYPNRPIHWIIGFPPGGGADIVSRIMARWLSERLGQQVIIENKPGAGTNIATEAVVNAPPDGYTMLWAGISNAINAMLYPGLSFDFLRDIAPVAGIVLFPLVIEAHPSVPAKSITELVALAKANPGKITLASRGRRIAQGESRRQHGARAVSRRSADGQRPPRRTSPGRDRRRGGLASPHPLRCIARVGGDHGRAARGLARCRDCCRDNEAAAWTGVGVPRGTPDAIVKLLNHEINAGLMDPALKARFAELTVTPMIFAPAEFGAYMAAETEKWTKVIKVAGIKAE
jgi:tripartite-type tricarboxylate transporter receptor subunit TctC